jgi:hypothetical protein
MSLKQQVQRNLSAAYVLTDDDTFVGFVPLKARQAVGATAG